jgi:hypothetical protein
LPARKSNRGATVDTGSAYGRTDATIARGCIADRKRPAGSTVPAALVTIEPPRRRPSTNPSAASRA